MWGVCWGRSLSLRLKWRHTLTEFGSKARGDLVCDTPRRASRMQMSASQPLAVLTSSPLHPSLPPPSPPACSHASPGFHILPCPPPPPASHVHTQIHTRTRRRTCPRAHRSSIKTLVKHSPQLLMTVLTWFTCSSDITYKRSQIPAGASKAHQPTWATAVPDGLHH